MQCAALSLRRCAPHQPSGGAAKPASPRARRGACPGGHSPGWGRSRAASAANVAPSHNGVAACLSVHSVTSDTKERGARCSESSEGTAPRGAAGTLGSGRVLPQSVGNAPSAGKGGDVHPAAMFIPQRSRGPPAPPAPPGARAGLRARPGSGSARPDRDRAPPAPSPPGGAFNAPPLQERRRLLTGLHRDASLKINVSQ